MNINTRSRAVALALSIAMLTPTFALAQSTDITSQIQALMNQIDSLRHQIEQLGGRTFGTSTASTTMPWRNHDGDGMMGSSTRPLPPVMMGSSTMPAMPCPAFDRDLSQGKSGDDVKGIQQTLIQNNVLPEGSDTGFFGRKTREALAKMQQMFGISSSTNGFFGPVTRMFFKHRCGDGQGDIMMGSSTRPMMQDDRRDGNRDDRMMGSSTRPMMNDHRGPDTMMMGSSTMPRRDDDHMMMSSSTRPMPMQGQGDGHPMMPPPPMQPMGTSTNH